LNSFDILIGLDVDTDKI